MFLEEPTEFGPYHPHLHRIRMYLFIKEGFNFISYIHDVDTLKMTDLKLVFVNVI